MQLSQNEDPYVQRVRPTSGENLLIEHSTGRITNINSGSWAIDRGNHRLYLNEDVLDETEPIVSVHIPVGTLNGENRADKVEENARAILPILRYSTVSDTSDDEHSSHDFDAPIVELWLGQTEEADPIWTRGAIERLLP